MNDDAPIQADPEIMDAVSALHKALKGRPPSVQGAALAEALASWLSGHQVPCDPRSERELRESMLQMHISMVRKLLPLIVALQRRRRRYV